VIQNYSKEFAMTDIPCDSAHLRLLGNIAFVAAKMQWQDEAEAIYGALAPVVETKVELYFAWMGARCELGDMAGACELMARLESLPDAPADMLLMARCYVQCCGNAPEWVDSARRVVQGGPDAFGYETALAMLEEHDLQRLH
jgi:hypothetical protein